MHLTRFASSAVAVSLALFALTGCAREEAAAPSATAPASASPSPSEPGECSRQYITTVIAGQLTVGVPGTSRAPFFTEDSHKVRDGYEAELVYSIAKGLGFRPATVAWRTVAIDPNAIAVPENVDFVIGQLPATRNESLDIEFSEPYLEVPHAVVAATSSPLAASAAVSGLRELRLGASRSGLALIDDVIKPTSAAVPIGSLKRAHSALVSQAVDAVVLDLVNAERLVADGKGALAIVGTLPAQAHDQRLGMAFAAGNPLIACVDGQLADLAAQGVLDELSGRVLGAAARRELVS